MPRRPHLAPRGPVGIHWQRGINDPGYSRRWATQVPSALRFYPFLLPRLSFEQASSSSCCCCFVQAFVRLLVPGGIR